MLILDICHANADRNIFCCLRQWPWEMCPSPSLKTVPVDTGFKFFFFLAFILPYHPLPHFSRALGLVMNSRTAVKCKVQH